MQKQSAALFCQQQHDSTVVSRNSLVFHTERPHAERAGLRSLAFPGAGFASCHDCSPWLAFPIVKHLQYRLILHILHQHRTCFVVKLTSAYTRCINGFWQALGHLFVLHMEQTMDLRQDIIPKCRSGLQASYRQHRRRSEELLCLFRQRCMMLVMQE